MRKVIFRVREKWTKNIVKQKNSRENSNETKMLRRSSLDDLFKKKFEGDLVNQEFSFSPQRTT